MLVANRLIDLEHDAIGMRMLVGEPQIGVPHAAGLVEWPLALRRRRFERVGEAGKSLGPNRGQDVGLVLEIAIGRLGAAAQRLGELAHGDALIAETGEPLGGDPAQLGAEIGDVLFGQVARHRRPFIHTVYEKASARSNPVVRQAVSANSSRPISMRRISLVPAPIS